MKLPRARPICRAPNHFSPSVALYQHFVAPYNGLDQQRFASSVHAPPETSHFLSYEGDPSPPASEAPLDEPQSARLQLNARKHENVSKFRSQKSNSIQGHLQREANKTTRAVAELLLKSRVAFARREEYKGVVVEPIQATHRIPEEKWPWCVQDLRGSEKLAMDRLSKEIHAFYQFAKPTRAETFARRNVVEQVRTDVRPLFPGHALEIFGSERTGIALATSDIDLRMISREDSDWAKSNKPPSSAERRNLLKDLSTLRKKAFNNNKYLLPTLRHARYPLLALQDRASGIDIQIVLSNDTSKSREYIQHYMTEYPYIRQVYAVVRAMFEQRGLSDVFRGGFGSYSIFMMLVASLQHQSNERKDAAGALINFMYYWAYFDTRKHGVSVSPPDYFDKTEHPVLSEATMAKIAVGNHEPLPNYMLCLRDPADDTNDLGRKGVSILHLQATLRSLVNTMIKDVKANTRHSLLANVVGDIYATTRKRRNKLEYHGRRVMSKMQADIARTAKAIREENPTAQESATEEASVHGFLDAEKSQASTSGESGAGDFGDAVISISQMPSAEARKSQGVIDASKD
ncbi:hypothetical protein N0V90_002290 [Kalmusia sp. IMI 367209]|nr:hypothetical protein N0V90_002290 [Kalmusia sp. IMI 367209]